MRKIITLMLCIVMVATVFAVIAPLNVSGYQQGTAPGYPFCSVSTQSMERIDDFWWTPIEPNAGEPVTFYLNGWNTGWTEYMRIYVDWNQDKDWTDANEIVLAASGWWSGNRIFSSTVIVPTDAEDGQTWCRAVMRWLSWPASYGSWSYGGVIDKPMIVHAGIPATAEVEPKSLNLESMGNWMSFRITGFPDNPEYTPLDVDGTTCGVHGVGAELKFGTWNNNKYIGKADRLLIEDAIGAPGDEVELEVRGNLNDGTSLKGIATIRAH